VIIVSDTTAITTMLKVDQAKLLQQLFGELLIPQAMWDELPAFYPKLPGFVSLRPVAETNPSLVGIRQLGRGEAEAITLAVEIKADLLLTDDLLARSIAGQMNVRCMGLLGVVFRAKKLGLTSSVGETISLFETKGGLYLSDAVKAEALRMAGESG